MIEAAAGVELGVEGLRTIFTELDPLFSFEDQADYWINYDNPNNYWNVYMPQIKSAQEGGLLPEDKRFIPDDAFTAPDVYRTLLRYRTWYDQMLGGAANLDGEHAELAEIASNPLCEPQLSGRLSHPERRTSVVPGLSEIPGARGAGGREWMNDPER